VFCHSLASIVLYFKGDEVVGAFPLAAAILIYLIGAFFIVAHLLGVSIPERLYLITVGPLAEDSAEDQDFSSSHVTMRDTDYAGQGLPPPPPSKDSLDVGTIHHQDLGDEDDDLEYQPPGGV
jgi:hypothetical protein